MSDRSKTNEDRDVISVSGSKQPRSIDFLKELQMALDAARDVFNVSNPAPLQPAPEGSGLPGDKRTQSPERERMHDPRASSPEPKPPPFDRPPAPSPGRLRFEPPPLSEPEHHGRPRAPSAPPEFHAPQHAPPERPPLRPPPHARVASRAQRSDADEQRRRQETLQRLTQRPYPRPEASADHAPVRGRSWPVLAGLAALGIAAVGSAAFVAVQFLAIRPTAEVAAQNPHGRLVLSDLGGAANRPVALGVNVDAPPSGAFILIRGLPSGARITAGSAVGSDAWRVPVRQLAHAAVVPPPDFVGTMNLSVDLRLADDSVADSDVQRLKWTAGAPDFMLPKPVKTTPIAGSSSSFPQPPTTQAAAGAPQAKAGEPPVVERQPGQAAGAGLSRQLDRDEIANLLKRGDLALQNGDVAAARLLLRRAAEAGDAQAALALAATYDPGVLKQLGAVGARADIAQARAWYEKAVAMGSAEATRRLLHLAQQSQ